MKKGLCFKYSIPEMDRFLVTLANIGVHFSESNESICDKHPKGYDQKDILWQIATVTINGTYLQVTASSQDIHKRKGKAIPEAVLADPLHLFDLDPKTLPDLFRDFDEATGHRELPEIRPRRRCRKPLAV
jgi:hypothetical protein